MALRVRLARAGAKKKPFYHVVVAEARSPRDGKFIEKVGIYDPTRNPAEIRLEQERLAYWLGQGAQPSETVAHLIKKVSSEASSMSS